MDTDQPTVYTLSAIYPQVALYSSSKPQDKRLIMGLFPHLNWLKKQGIAIWDSATSIAPGQNKVEEAIRAALYCQIAIFLISIDFLDESFLDSQSPLSKAIPILQWRSRQQSLHLIPILLRECNYEFIFSHITPKNAQPIGKIGCTDRDKVWKELCKDICAILPYPCTEIGLTNNSTI